MNPQRRQILLLLLIVFGLGVGYRMFANAKDVFAWQDVSLIGKIIALVCNSIIDVINLSLSNAVGIVVIAGIAIWFFKSKTRKPE
ncbi:MAG: hypothetical protein ACLPYZ_03380 [Limisphaerales bacterium]